MLSDAEGKYLKNVTGLCKIFEEIMLHHREREREIKLR